MSILHQQRILVLNSSWVAVNTKTVQQGLSDLVAGAYVALDENLTPLKWSDWMKLPIREQDMSVQTPKLTIRVPTVMIAINYKKVPVKQKQLNMKNLREHYNDTDAYTGKKIKPGKHSMEHVTPRSSGGQTSWDNIALVDKDVNSKRGNLPLEKAGLKLQVPLSRPKPMPISHTIRNIHNVPEWDHHLLRQ